MQKLTTNATKAEQVDQGRGIDNECPDNERSGRTSSGRCDNERTSSGCRVVDTAIMEVVVVAAGVVVELLLLLLL